MNLLPALITNLLIIGTCVAGYLVDYYTNQKDESALSHQIANAKAKVKKSKNTALLLSLILAIFNTYYTYTESVKSDEISHNIDTIRKDNDSLKNANNYLRQMADSANKSLFVLNNQQTNQIVSQADSFKSTANKIQRSADVLLKYINGDEGIVFIEFKEDPGGGSFMHMVNPNKWALRDVAVNIYYYKDVANAIETVKGVRALNLIKLESKIIYKTYRQIFSGLEQISPTIIPTAPQHYFVDISIGSHSYYEELYLDPDGRSYAFVMHDFQAPNHPIIKHRNLNPIQLKEWKKVFKVDLNKVVLRGSRQ